jgi:hypothetical protein
MALTYSLLFHSLIITHTVKCSYVVQSSEELQLLCQAVCIEEQASYETLTASHAKEQGT